MVRSACDATDVVSAAGGEVICGSPPGIDVRVSGRDATLVVDRPFTDLVQKMTDDDKRTLRRLADDLGPDEQAMLQQLLLERAADEAKKLVERWLRR